MSSGESDVIYFSKVAFRASLKAAYKFRFRRLQMCAITLVTRSLPLAAGPAFVGNEVADVEGSGVFRRRRRPTGMCGVPSGVLKEGSKLVRRVV